LLSAECSLWSYSIRCLQSALHTAVLLMSGVQYITPTLRDILQWLPVVQRIRYKIAMMTFSGVRGTCSAYFRDVCRPVASVGARARLRSADQGDQVEQLATWCSEFPHLFSGRREQISVRPSN